MNKRPISVTIVAFLYLIVGIVGFAVHGREILVRHAFQYDDALIELTEVIALGCGVFILQGRNWARGLAVAWIAAHVAFSFFDSLQKAAIHCLFLVLIAYCLFQPDAGTFFKSPKKANT